MTLLHPLPCQPRIGRGVERLGRHPMNAQPTIFASVVQNVQHIEESDALRLGPPLKDDLLHDLDGKTIVTEAVAGGIAEYIWPTEPLILPPEGDAAFVGDGIAGIARTALAVGLLIEVAARNVEVQSLSVGGKWGKGKEAEKSEQQGE